MTDENYIAHLKERIHELEQGPCRFDCRKKLKDTFMAGFKAGADDCADSGRIICDDFFKEVTEAEWKRYIDAKG